MLTTLLIKRKLKKYNGILAGLGYHIEAKDNFKKFSYNSKEYDNLDECYYAICREILAKYNEYDEWPIETEWKKYVIHE